MSETLVSVDLAGDFAVDCCFTAPWAYHSLYADIAATRMARGAELVVVCHLVTEGACYVEIDGMDPVLVSAGEAIIFPRADAHRLVSEAGIEACATFDVTQTHRPFRLCYGGGGGVTRLVSGFLACDRRLGRMLLVGLPRLVKVNMADAAAGAWLQASIVYAIKEARSNQPGSACMLSKLAVILFVEVLRTYMGERADARVGWLSALRDEVVGSALDALHEHPERAWTLQDLAQVAGISRSVFAERFMQLVGCPPIQYLTQWRMYLAGQLLRQNKVPLATVALEVGYQTDTAFSRAFRREYGVPPATWRRLQARKGAGAAQSETA